MQGKNAAVAPSLEEQLQQETGAERQNEGTGNGEMSKRSQIQNMEESRKSKFEFDHYKNQCISNFI